MKQPIVIVFFIFFAVSMIIVVLHLFPVGDPRLPSYAGFVSQGITSEEVVSKADSSALRYNRNAAFDVGVSSVVGAIILDYRGYDTLYETIVLFTTTVSVLAIIGKESEDG